MTINSILKLLPDLLRISKEAGNAILSIYNNDEDWQIQAKSDHTPITLADRKANAIICKGLEELEQVFPIISEENKEVPFESRKTYHYYWLVDPLDGTKEFVKRNGEFTVNIALIKNNAPIFGVVHAPVLDETYYGIKGHGAFLIKDAQETALSVPTFSMSDPNLNAVCSRSHLNEPTADFLEKLNQPNKVSKGSSLKFLMIASGQAHIYPRLAPTMEWDTAAAQAVLEAAGGVVLNADTQQPLLYNKENLRNPHFIAYGKVIDNAQG